MRRAPQRSRLVYATALLAAFGAIASYTLALTVWDYLEFVRQRHESGRGFVRPQLQLMMWGHFVEGVIGVWFFGFGATIGSFLNVVVYRMPLGISLSASGSRCPFCMTPIWARDNLPVIGWLALGGRCRRCRLPISGRYPLVEAITGGMFLAMYFAELVPGGGWLPGGPFPRGLDIGGVILDGRYDLIGLFVFHMFTLSVLWTGALMVYDHHAAPARFWLTCLGGAIGFVFVWPFAYAWLSQWTEIAAVDRVLIYPIGWNQFPGSPWAGFVAVDGVTMLVGGLFGGGLGYLLAGLLPEMVSLQRSGIEESSGEDSVAEVPSGETSSGETSSGDVGPTGLEPSPAEKSLPGESLLGERGVEERGVEERAAEASPAAERLADGSLESDVDCGVSGQLARDVESLSQVESGVVSQAVSQAVSVCAGPGAGTLSGLMAMVGIGFGWQTAGMIGLGSVLAAGLLAIVRREWLAVTTWLAMVLWFVAGLVLGFWSWFAGWLL